MDYLKEIYPSQLTVEKANKSDHLADYLDLTFIIENGTKLSTRLYGKRDDFDFHIVSFPFLSGNIPPGPFYGVYISQLVRYPWLSSTGGGAPLKTFALPGIWSENNRITIEICITIDFAPLEKIPRRKPVSKMLLIL